MLWVKTIVRSAALTAGASRLRAESLAGVSARSRRRSSIAVRYARAAPLPAPSLSASTANARMNSSKGSSGTPYSPTSAARRAAIRPVSSR